LEEIKEMKTENSKWMNTQELAEYIGMSTEQIELWRKENYGPSYLKLGKRKVIYPKAMVAEFIVANPIKTM
jgi:predicted DNA-binding transcriptional regulator AlpA